MLQTLQDYSPFKSNWAEWWYGKTNSPDTTRATLSPVQEEEQTLNESSLTPEDNNLSTIIEPCIDSSSINKESSNLSPCGLLAQQLECDIPVKPSEHQKVSSSDEDYKTFSDYGASSRRSTVDYDRFLGTNQISDRNIFSSDDDYKTCSETPCLLNEQYGVDDKVRQLILQSNGLEKDNDSDKNSVHIHKGRDLPVSSTDAALLSTVPIYSTSAPATLTEKQARLFAGNIDNIYEYTDSDADGNIKTYIKERRNTTSKMFPFSFFGSAGKKKPKRRRAISYCSNYVTDAKESLVNFKHHKSYGSSRRTKTVIHDRLASDSNYDSDHMTINTDLLYASYLNHHRPSLSESSILLSTTSLNSSWSEYTISVAEARECRESDSVSVMSDYSLTRVPLFRRTTRKSEKYLHGQYVNESFLENECFCCPCVIL